MWRIFGVFKFLLIYKRVNKGDLKMEENLTEEKTVIKKDKPKKDYVKRKRTTKKRCKYGVCDT